MTNNNPFTIEHAKNSIQHSKTIDSNEAYVRGLREAEVTYACGHRWIACEGNEQHRELGLWFNAYIRLEH